MKPILEVQNIGKSFTINHQQASYLSLRDRIIDALTFGKKQSTETFWALNDVTFDVQEGEAIGIVGKNGAGKSTLLKILSRITPPTNGRIISRGRMASLLEVGTGFHSELTGRENIFLNGSILGMRKAEIHKHFDAIVDFSGVERFLDTPLKHYSSGMQLRLAFAVAAFLEPEILVIDEVLAVGDAEFQEKCMGKMAEVTSQGRTVLFVSHNMAAVEHLCTKGIFLEKGGVKLVDKIEKVVEHYLRTENSDDGSADEIKLTDQIVVDKFQIDKSSLVTFETLAFDLIISSRQPNRFSDLALLIYNHLDERVAILDFRHKDLWGKSSNHQTLNIKGVINNIPLIEGTYSFGLYISSALHRGDFYNLKRFEIVPPKTDFIPYAVKHRGYIELECVFEIH
jgi:lipopolysaccharide transport system ATP-binding protein